MRLRTIGFTLFGLFSLGSAVMLYQAGVIRLPGQPRHPVTESMRQKADNAKAQGAVDFQLDSVEKGKIRMSSLWNDKPLLVVFTLPDCPCSIDSQPFFNQLAKNYEGKLNVLGVIKGPKLDSSNYKVNMSVPYPMGMDPQGAVAAVYQAPQSVYSVLIRPGGKVEKLWPGYSKKILAEMNGLIAELAGTEAVPLDTTNAPEQDSSGCSMRE